MGRSPAGGPAFARATYRARDRIERLVNRLEQSRRAATRYEERAGHHAAMLTIARALMRL